MGDRTSHRVSVMASLQSRPNTPRWEIPGGKWNGCAQDRRTRLRFKAAAVVCVVFEIQIAISRVDKVYGAVLALEYCQMFVQEQSLLYPWHVRETLAVFEKLRDQHAPKALHRVSRSLISQTASSLAANCHMIVQVHRATSQSS